MRIEVDADVLMAAKMDAGGPTLPQKWLLQERGHGVARMEPRSGGNPGLGACGARKTPDSAALHPRYGALRGVRGSGRKPIVAARSPGDHATILEKGTGANNPPFADQSGVARMEPRSGGN